MAELLNMRGRRGIVPPGAVYIGRAVPQLGLPASKWANPFRIGRDGMRDEVIAQYRVWLRQQPALLAALAGLGGKDFACWCAPLPCHGDVLRELSARSMGWGSRGRGAGEAGGMGRGDLPSTSV